MIPYFIPSGYTSIVSLGSRRRTEEERHGIKTRTLATPLWSDMFIILNCHGLRQGDNSCNPSTLEVEAGELVIHGCVELHGGFEVSFGCMRTCSYLLLQKNSAGAVS